VDPVAALSVVAHGGVAGAVVESLLALLLVGLAAAVWLGRGDDGEDEEEGETPGNELPGEETPRSAS
jgi:hypothetical protein